MPPRLQFLRGEFAGGVASAIPAAARHLPPLAAAAAVIASISPAGCARPPTRCAS